MPSGWTTYAGSWGLNSEAFVNSAVDTQGDKAIGGPNFSNFTLTGDVQLTASQWNAGFLVRASNPAVGTDSVNGYYLGVDNSGQLIVGKESTSSGYTALITPDRVSPLPASPLNIWYHLTVQAVGCSIRLTAQRADASTPVQDVTVTDCSYSSGQVGVRTYNASAQWRYLSVTPN